MTDTIEVKGEQYEVDDNPSLGTVRDVQSMQMGIITDYLSQDKLMEMDGMAEEDIIQAILDEGGKEAFESVMFERNMLLPAQTISLACDTAFEPNEFEDMGAQDFKQAKQVAEEALGGDANDFFEDLGIVTSLTEEEMRNQM